MDDITGRIKQVTNGPFKLPFSHCRLENYFLGSLECDYRKPHLSINHLKDNTSKSPPVWLESAPMVVYHFRSCEEGEGIIQTLGCHNMRKFVSLVPRLISPALSPGLSPQPCPQAYLPSLVPRLISPALFPGLSPQPCSQAYLSSLVPRLISPAFYCLQHALKRLWKRG